MFRIESRWKPNFCARSRKMSSISSLDSGIWRSVVHAGYWSLTPDGGTYSTNAVALDSDGPIRDCPNDSADGAYPRPYTSMSESVSCCAREPCEQSAVVCQNVRAHRRGHMCHCDRSISLGHSGHCCCCRTHRCLCVRTSRRCQSHCRRIRIDEEMRRGRMDLHVRVLAKWNGDRTFSKMPWKASGMGQRCRCCCRRKRGGSRWV